MATGNWRGILFFVDFNDDLLAAQLHRKVMQQMILPKLSVSNSAMAIKR
jgi:hypothetical protein